ncbi:unnamed protein product [Rotaria sp. Silwood2]|nr:unnamed protein product [Rotaria sp. Silwood2]
MFRVIRKSNLFVFFLIILVPPVQSILSHTSTATFDSNQACSSASSIDSHADDYILPQKSIFITASHLTDEQIDHLDQFLQHFNIHYSDEIDEQTTHLITDDTTIPFVCALSSKVVHALARHLIVLLIRWIDECLHIILKINKQIYTWIQNNAPILNVYIDFTLDDYESDDDMENI